MENINNEDFGRCIWCFRPTATSHLCDSCARRYHITGAWVAGEREGCLKRLINDYKFESRREASVVLARLLASALPALPSGTTLAWVPTARAAVRGRSFDHMERIAKQLSRELGMPLTRPLRRLGNTVQHELNREERRQTARLAYAMAGPVDDHGPLLLIDDVMTTGATLSACVDVLRQSGYESDIYLGVIARQVPNSRI